MDIVQTILLGSVSSTLTAWGTKSSPATTKHAVETGNSVVMGLIANSWLREDRTIIRPVFIGLSVLAVGYHGYKTVTS